MKNTLRRERAVIHPDQRGTALALALVVVTVVAMLGAGFLQLTASLTSRQSESVDSMKAFYLAEAGLAESFHAVRMGRTGQIGSLEAPARYGDGLVWVDAVAIEDGTVRLDSNGLSGRGRSSLSLVVEPVEIALGFFAKEDIVVDSPIMLDGFSSDEGEYHSSVPPDEGLFIDPSYPFLHDDPVNRILFYEGSFYRYTTYENDRVFVDAEVAYEHIANAPEFDTWGCDPDDFMDEDWLSDYDSGHEYDGVLAYFTKYDQRRELASDHDELMGAPVSDPWGEVVGDPWSPGGGGGSMGPTTGSGGLLGSNGDVHFALPAGETAEVWGDVQPGPDGVLTGLDAVTVSGDTTPRTAIVELPDVELPIIAQALPVRHEDLLPMLIAPGSSGYARIEVAPDAELVIRGPATVLVGSLILEPGALLTLDTRAGEVSLFVTDELDLQAGASVLTSGSDPADMSVQVSSTANDPMDPAVKLDATGQFHGTVYAPRTDVRIGSDFEIYGSVIAERLDIAAGARLHFDNAGLTESALPRILGWRLIEVPAALKGGRDPYRLLGVDPQTIAALADAHDLGAVEMELTYIDLTGSERTYSGVEAQFDWSAADRVVKVERNPERKLDETDPDGEKPPLEPVDTGEPRGFIQEALDTLTGADLKDYFIAKAPLTESELLAFIADDKMDSSNERDLLIALTPLPESVLTTLVQKPDGVYDSSSGRWLNPDGVDQGKLADVLVANSPLPRSTLDAVEAASSSLLADSEKVRILGAQ